MNAWLVRAGKQGEREQSNLEAGVVGGGFSDVPDLTEVESREQLTELLRGVLPGASAGTIGNYSGQLWAFRSRMETGDLAVMPLKANPQVAIGRIDGPYEYRGAEAPDRRHLRSVEWLRTDIARTAIHQDLRFTLGAFMTVCQLTRHDAAWRLDQLVQTGQDPGARAEAVGGGSELDEGDEATDASNSLAVDVERYARDRFSTYVSERFSGHGLERLVAAVLTAEGFRCDVADEGADGGIDILAGRGPLGLDPPRIAVQVKSGTSPVDAPTVQQLHGAITTHGADQGLLVAWGGLTRPARQALQTQRFTIRVWGSDDLLDAICEIYEQLPDETRVELPLKPVWAVVEEPPGT